MTDQEPTQFDELNKLTAMLEENQVRQAKELHALQTEYADYVDRTEFNNRRKHSRELHEQVSKTIQGDIEQTKEQTRKALADSLMRPESNSDADRKHYQDCIDMIEGAKQDPKQVEELIHRALRWQDRTLARLLVRSFCGDREHITMHKALATIGDPTVKALFDFENSWGSYNRNNRPAVTPGWLTPEQAKEVWADGVPGRIKSPFVRKQFHDWRKDQ